MNLQNPSRKQWPITFDRVKARPEGRKGRYVAHFERNGRHEKRALRTTVRELAYQAALRLETELQAGTLVSTPKKMLIVDAINQFMVSKRQENISPKTDVKYHAELKAFSEFVTFLRIRCLCQITSDTIEKYRQHRRYAQLVSHRPGAQLHEKTLFVAMTIVKGFFKWCLRKKFLPSNPAADIQVKKPPLLPKFAPDLIDVVRLIDTAEEPRKTQLAVLAFTGMRSGEMQLLAPESVDLNGNWLSVPSLKAKLTRVRPIRKVPIHPSLRSLLECHIQQHVKAGQPFLFCSQASSRYPDGGHAINTKHLCDYVKSLAKRLGMRAGHKNDGLVVHSLRHFFETHCINQRVPQRAVDSWLGHTGDRSMGAVYYRLSDMDSQKLIQSVDFGKPAHANRKETP